jgi:mRNA interferase MazF
MERGTIVRADLDPVVGHEQGGRRPFLVVSREHFNLHSGTVIGFAITSQRAAPFPFSLPVPEGLLPRPSWVKISQVRTLSDRRLGNVVGQTESAFVENCLAGLLRHCKG